ncbi:MAG: hypothetical protein DMG41_27475 [Acidobacteria bacterium]|nr:MAG: hypothetical protein AUH13_14980 [Acidobacteria bacterium 13_2_20CM_58_27]PYT84455.1 MAG: hypothetical protein DMG41_27475 [Acidobacteriota bacterium]
MTLMMLGVAMGFAPYAGHGWATFEVLSKDHSGLLDGLMPHLSDKNQVARCAASAGIIRLSTAKENPKSNCREHGLRNVSEELEWTGERHDESAESKRIRYYRGVLAS